jgi:lipopolysaccharide export system permease protein
MILNKYFLKDVFLYTASVSIIFLLIIVSSRSIQYLEQAAVGEINPSVVGWIILYRLPEFFQIILPFSFFLSLVLTIGRLSADSELTIFEQNGFSQKRIILLSLLPATLVASISLALSIFISPVSSLKVANLMETKSSEEIFQSLQPGGFLTLNKNLLIYLKEREGDELQSVFLKSSNKDSSFMEGVIFSEFATLGNNKDKLILQNGSIYSSNKERSSNLTFQEFQIDISDKSDSKKNLVSGESDTIGTAKMQWNFSLAIISIIGVLLAIPISKVNPREGRYRNVLPAIFLFVLYLGLLITGRGWIESGSLQPFPGLYMIHLIFLFMGAYFLHRKKQKR